MKQITSSVIEVFKNIHSYLNEKDFKNHLSKEMPKYDISLDFLKTFREYIDKEQISKQSLTKECIKFLMENNLFDVNIWKENIKYKDISILCDDEFVVSTGVNADDVIANSKNIPDCVVERFFGSCGENAKKNIIMNYKGDKISLESIVNNISSLGDIVFCNKFVIDDIHSDDSKIANLIMTSGAAIPITLVVKLMSLKHIPNLVRENIDNLNLIDLDLSSENHDSERIISEFGEILVNIIQRYDTDIVEKIFNYVHDYAKNIILRRDLLRIFLAQCDDISEEVLINLIDVFMATNTKQELVAYAKNYEYRTLLTAIVCS